MMTKNVYFSTRPDEVIVTVKGDRAIVEFPLEVSEVTTDDGVQWCAKRVYSLFTFARKNLKELIERNYEQWLNRAMQTVSADKVTLDDVASALVELADMIATQDDALVEIAGLMAEGE